MATQAIASHGTLLKIGDGATPEVFTTVAEVGDITLPNFGNEKEDVTVQTTPGRKRDYKVTLQKGCEIVNSCIRGPAIIGENTRIVNSYIGPFTSIYHHVVIENSEIEHSIVLEHSSIIDIPQRIEDSLIGRNVEIKRSPLKPKAYKMTLGDNSRVGIL